MSALTIRLGRIKITGKTAARTDDHHLDTRGSSRIATNHPSDPQARPAIEQEGDKRETRL